MKAPDKIFISIERTYGASNGQVIGMAVPYSEKQSENDIEYIRKDALLEWLNIMLEFSAQSFQFQRNYAYGKVIDKLNKM